VIFSGVRICVINQGILINNSRKTKKNSKKSLAAIYTHMYHETQVANGMGTKTGKKSVRLSRWRLSSPAHSSEQTRQRTSRAARCWSASVGATASRRCLDVGASIPWACCSDLRAHTKNHRPEHEWEKSCRKKGRNFDLPGTLSEPTRLASVGLVEGPKMVTMSL